MKKIFFPLFIILAIFLLVESASAANSLTARLKGRLLLQVEDRGRIWYVDPVGSQKHEVTFANALELFKKLSLGITNSDLNKIPIDPEAVSDQLDTDNDGFLDKDEVKNGYNPEIASNPDKRGNDKVLPYPALMNRLKGRLLLQVEDRGRIWYVDLDGKRWEVTWGNLMSLFTKLALGIKNTDLDEVGEWQTYHSNNYGFEIKFPSGWFVYNDPDGSLFLQPDQEVAGAIPGPHADSLKITAVDKNGQDLNGYINNFYGVTEFRKQTISLAGQIGYLTASICEGVGCGNQTWFIEKNNKFYILQVFLSSSATYQSIVNTLKLFPPTVVDPTTSWQIYRNEAYGFEFRIPANYIAEETGIKEIWFSTDELLAARLKNVENCNDDRQETICEPEMIGSQLEFTAYFQFSENEKINKKIETINGISWQNFEVPGLYPVTYYETENNGRQYHFAPHLNKDEITKILSTFKFID